MQSESIAALAAALSKAQGAMKPAAKDSQNPHFRTSYADLASVWEAARKPLADNQLAVIQTTEEDEQAVVVVTTLAHSSGEWIQGRLKLRPLKPDPQGMGSALTYARRYALAAIAGVAPDDDDGNAASTPPNLTRQATNGGATPTPRQVMELAGKAGVKPAEIPASLAAAGILPGPLPSSEWTAEHLTAAVKFYSRGEHV